MKALAEDVDRVNTSASSFVRFGFFTFVFAISLIVTNARAADLSETDKQFLAQYEKVRAGLAADNLADAKKAATDLGEQGSSIAATDSIIKARKEFATLSDHAISLAGGQSGYYVVNCPMLKKDWVQTSTKISNPYAGSSMLTCGSVKK